MTPRILHGLVVIASVLLVACYPYPEPKPTKPAAGHKANPPPPTQVELNNPDATPDPSKPIADNKQPDANLQPPELPNGNSVKPNKPPGPPKPDYEYAKKAPGREGFVLSPYNNKIIDVRDDAGKQLARGTLVQDPTYPAAEKKYFRVP
jgi:hypothetical protein